MINVQDIRKGNVFKLDGDLWTVMHMQHVSPGKGGAFVKIKARSQNSGNSKEMNFRSGEKIEKVDVFQKDATYLYQDGDDYVLMDDESYEQYHVSADLCEDVGKFVLLNGKAHIFLHDEKVIAVEVPNFVELQIVQADPGVKGDTVTKTMKTVEVETGYKVQVPLFINEGDVIKIDTSTGEYSERVKN